MPPGTHICPRSAWFPSNVDNSLTIPYQIFTIFKFSTRHSLCSLLCVHTCTYRSISRPSGPNLRNTTPHLPVNPPPPQAGRARRVGCFWSPIFVFTRTIFTTVFFLYPQFHTQGPPPELIGIVQRMNSAAPTLPHDSSPHSLYSLLPRSTIFDASPPPAPSTPLETQTPGEDPSGYYTNRALLAERPRLYFPDPTIHTTATSPKNAGNSTSTNSSNARSTSHFAVSRTSEGGLAPVPPGSVMSKRSDSSSSLVGAEGGGGGGEGRASTSNLSTSTTGGGLTRTRSKIGRDSSFSSTTGAVSAAKYVYLQYVYLFFPPQFVCWAQF